MNDRQIERNIIKFANFDYIDFHTHFFPQKMLTAIWQYFENNYWPIYKKDSPENLAQSLISEFRVKKFILLNYAHKSGIARSLNDWTYGFCNTSGIKPYCIPFGTVHPDDKDIGSEMDRIFEDFGFAGLKLQLMVTDFSITDKRLEIVFQKIIQYNKILLVHIGTGPSYSNYYPDSRLEGAYVGVKHLNRFLEQYPDIKVVVPHLGAEEYDKMWELTGIFPNLYFDTAMIGVKDNPAFDDKLSKISNEKLYSISDRLLFGSDFPNIPYRYQKSVIGWLERDMEYSFYEKLFFRNGKTLLG
ncbi:MAG: amidohydrolase family protein [Candidatus Hodarchaeales archaeon]